MRIGQVKIWYVGVSSRSGAREYQFIVENHDQPGREVVLAISDSVFTERQLSFQEAPDFCYQKLKGKLENEAADGPIRSRELITPLDVARYRDTHEAPKRRSMGSKRTVT